MKFKRTTKDFRSVPIYVICYNNGWQVDYTVKQLSRFKQRIIIIDNRSSSYRTKKILRQLDSMENITVLWMDQNYGHRVLFRDELYHSVPQYFALTDPDLEYSASLPDHFIQTLAYITDELNVTKAGLALEIPDEVDTYSDIYHEKMTIRKWEKQFWEKPVNHPLLEIYEAGIDTTFAVYNKNIDNQRCLRLAGIYKAKHLPWYKNYVENLPAIDVIECYGNTKCSTISSIITRHFETTMPNLHYLVKNDVTMVVELDGSDARDGFWKNHYSSWESETFEVFDRYVSEDQVVIDIGTWIGPTVLYLAQKCARIIAVEADQDAASTLKRNIGYSGLGAKVEVVDKALYSDESGVLFGPNAFRTADGLNASTSQVLADQSVPSGLNYFVSSVTWTTLVKSLRPREKVCLVKVDIEGGEEHILRDILQWAWTHRVPAYISFHHTWWKNRDLNRFDDLFNLFGMEAAKAKILADPFVSIVFKRKMSRIIKFQNSLRKRFKSLKVP